MKLKCDTCSKPRLISGPVKIYSGEFCSAGCWDERGNEDSQKDFDAMLFDPWKNCSHYKPINRHIEKVADDVIAEKALLLATGEIPLNACPCRRTYE